MPTRRSSRRRSVTAYAGPSFGGPHVAGITNLVSGDSPKLIATQSVLDLMRKLEEPKRKQWGPVHGAEWVARWTYSNTIVTSEPAGEAS